MRKPINMVETAEKILGADNVTAEMAEYLEEVQGLCVRMGGEISSRQITALAIATWRQIERNNSKISMQIRMGGPA